MTQTKNDTYRVAPGHSLQIPDLTDTSGERRVRLLPGDVLPEGTISAKELPGLVAAGVLEKNGTRVLPNGKKRKSPSKWNREPSALASKTYDQLCVMIGEIDKDEPLPATKELAIELLTKGYDIAADAAANAQRAATSGLLVQLSQTVQVASDRDGTTMNQTESDPEDEA